MAYELVLNGSRIGWAVCGGDGTASYGPGSIVCHYDSTPLCLPSWLTAARDQLVAADEEHHGALPSVRPIHNDPRYAFASYRSTRSRGGPRLDLHFRPSDYFTFIACQRMLHTAVIADESGTRVSPLDYLATRRWRQPTTALSHSFGATLMVVTSDGSAAIGRRSCGVAIRPGELNVAVSEGLSTVDHDPATGAPDIFACAVRGIGEELGVAVPRDEVHFLSLGVDTETNQWGMLGIVHLCTDSSTLQRAWEHAPDASEQSLSFAPFTPKDMARFVAANGPWAPEALACIYHALVHTAGPKDATEAFT